MISAIVLAPDVAGGDDTIRIGEVVVRSLGWLVSAVVAGVVRDVTMAAPAGLGLTDLADQAGCAIVQADTEGERLAMAIAAVRGPLVLIVNAGFQPQAGLIEEVDDLVRHQPQIKALILATPATMFQRLFPDRAPMVGLLAPISICRGRGQGGLRALVRSTKGVGRLRHRASSIS